VSMDSLRNGTSVTPSTNPSARTITTNRQDESSVGAGGVSAAAAPANAISPMTDEHGVAPRHVLISVPSTPGSADWSVERPASPTRRRERNNKRGKVRRSSNAILDAYRSFIIRRSMKVVWCDQQSAN
jgi:hypothetical protein